VNIKRKIVTKKDSWLRIDFLIALCPSEKEARAEVKRRRARLVKGKYIVRRYGCFVVTYVSSAYEAELNRYVNNEIVKIGGRNG
jgi:hypothetical protein